MAYTKIYQNYDLNWHKCYSLGGDGILYTQAEPSNPSNFSAIYAVAADKTTAALSLGTGIMMSFEAGTTFHFTTTKFDQFTAFYFAVATTVPSASAGSFIRTTLVAPTNVVQDGANYECDFVLPSGGPFYIYMSFVSNNQTDLSEFATLTSATTMGKWNNRANSPRKRGSNSWGSSNYKKYNGSSWKT